jgi:MFS family permease
MTTETIRKILTRDFILGFFAQFAFITVFHLLIPTLPIYLSRSGLKEAEIGVLIGIFFVSSLGLRPFVGKALSKIPEKSFMIVGGLLFTLTSFGYLLAPPFWPFFIVRALQGIGLAFFHTASFTLIANISPEAHRGQSLSYFFLAPNVSLALAPSLGMSLVNHFGFPLLFWVCSGVSLCSLLIASRLGKREVPPPEDSSGAEAFLPSWDVLPPCVVSFFNLIMWGAMTAFFPLYALNHGVANSGLFFTTIAVMFFLGRAFGGKILDLYSRERVIPSLLVTSAISMAILAFSKTLPMFILAAVIWGIGNALLQPAVMAYVLDRAGSSTGPAIGMYTLVSDFGLGLGPAIMGIVIGLSSYPTMFLCLTLTGIINLTYFYIFVIKKGTPKPGSSIIPGGVNRAP